MSDLTTQMGLFQEPARRSGVPCGHLLIAGLIFFSHSPFAHAQSGHTVPEFLKAKTLSNQTAKKLTLQGLIEVRCLKFLNPGPTGKLNCRRFARDVHESLDETNFTFVDYLTNERRVNSVCFRTDLLHLMQDPRVYYFLDELNSELDLSLTGLDLWSLTLKHAGNSREALTWIAALFQDTTSAQSQVQYLREQRSRLTGDQKVFDSVFAQFHEAVSRLDPSRLSRYDVNQFYPDVLPTRSEYFTPSIYHFYVPALLANRLLEKGYSATYARFGASVFNYLYEVFSDQPRLTNALTEPRHIQGDSTVLDILAGDMGSLFGAGLSGYSDNMDMYFSIIQHDPAQFLRWAAR